MKTLVLTLTVWLLSVSVTYGSDLEDLARRGYAVVDETQVDGEFEGYDFDKRIPLMNGLVFVCATYNYFLFRICWRS